MGQSQVAERDSSNLALLQATKLHWCVTERVIRLYPPIVEPHLSSGGPVVASNGTSLLSLALRTVEPARFGIREIVASTLPAAEGIPIDACIGSTVDDTQSVFRR